MQKRWHHMELTICQWYSAYTNQIRSKTSSQITLSGMKGRVQTLCQNCASENQHKARKAHGKARSSHYGGPVRPRKLGQKNEPQWKTGRKEELDQTQTQSCNEYQNWAEQFKHIAREAKASVKNSVLKERWHSSGNSTNKRKGMLGPKQPQT